MFRTTNLPESPLTPLSLAMRPTATLFRSLIVALLSFVLVHPVVAEEQIGPDRAEWEATRAKGVEYLKVSQDKTGSWSGGKSPGLSALALTGLLRSGVSADDPVAQKGLKHLEQFVRDDGGIYAEGSNHRNYETSIALLAFKAANADKRYDDRIAKAVSYLKGLQWDKTEGIDEDDPAFGGAGYGSHQRPDLSNTSFLLEALQEAGVSADDPAMQRALIFVSRTQNLESEHNNTPFAKMVEDGGFYYTPAAGGTSQAGLTADGGLRSYASMTYAGLKSMIYAGVKEDDVRVKAATDWIRKFYSVKENPGLGEQGLYYYYHTFAKALTVMQQDTLTDDKGVEHDWRRELTEHLMSLQQKNGSWVNNADRWYEGDPNLVTAYALLALEHCEPRAAKSGDEKK